MSEGEGLDLQALLGQMQDLTQRLTDAQAEAADEVIEGTSGGGKVRVTMTGAGELEAVHIDPSVVDPDDVELLEDLLVVAFRDAMERAAEQASQRMSGGLGALFGGGLGDLFGGGTIDASASEAATEASELSPPSQLPGPPPSEDDTRHPER